MSNLLTGLNGLGYWITHGLNAAIGPVVPPVVKPTVSIGPIPSTGGGARVTWTDAEAGVTGYDIEYDGVVTVGVTSPQDYLIADMTTSHAWRVRGTNSAGNGPWSDYAYLGGVATGSTSFMGIVFGNLILSSSSSLNVRNALLIGDLLISGSSVGGNTIFVLNNGRLVKVSASEKIGIIS